MQQKDLSITFYLTTSKCAEIVKKWGRGLSGPAVRWHSAYVRIDEDSSSPSPDPEVQVYCQHQCEINKPFFFQPDDSYLKLLCTKNNCGMSLMHYYCIIFAILTITTTETIK